MLSANQGLSRLRQPQVLAFSTVPDAIWAILVDCKMADRHRIRTLQAVYGLNKRKAGASATTVSLRRSTQGIPTRRRSQALALKYREAQP